MSCLQPSRRKGKSTEEDCTGEVSMGQAPNWHTVSVHIPLCRPARETGNRTMSVCSRGRDNGLHAQLAVSSTVSAGCGLPATQITRAPLLRRSEQSPPSFCLCSRSRPLVMCSFFHQMDGISLGPNTEALGPTVQPAHTQNIG